MARMADITGDVVVQVEQADGTFVCHAFSDVPAARASWIVLQSSGSAAGRGHASALFVELEAVLLGSSPSARSAQVSCDAPDELDPSSCPGRRKLLVLLASADRHFDDRAWYAKWQSDADDACVATVIPDSSTFDDALPPALR